MDAGTITNKASIGVTWRNAVHRVADETHAAGRDGSDELGAVSSGRATGWVARCCVWTKAA